MRKTKLQVEEAIKKTFSGLEGNPHAEEVLRLVLSGTELSAETVALLAVAHEIRQAS